MSSLSRKLLEGTPFDDGTFCNGEDRCDKEGVCRSSGNPCKEGTICREYDEGKCCIENYQNQCNDDGDVAAYDSCGVETGLVSDCLTAEQNGHCAAGKCGCNSGYYGSNCEPCTCVNGTCDDGTSGQGICTECLAGWDGVNCEMCDKGYWGASCEPCACEAEQVCSWTGECGKGEIKIAAPVGETGDLFGHLVSTDGDRILVGAPNYESGSQGSAYIYERTAGDEWTLAKKLSHPKGSTDAFFGGALRIRGEVAVVGARFDAERGANSGSAFVFELNESTGDWEHTAQLFHPEARSGDWFGVQVWTDGHTIDVGAPYHDSELGQNSGTADVFERNQSGNWEHKKTLKAFDGANAAANDDYGSGAAYVFEKDSNGEWVEAKTPKLVAFDRAAYEHFGTSTSVSGNRIIVGASKADGITTSTGAVYLFERDTVGNWIAQQPKLFASDGVSDGRYGLDCEISGDMIVTGAYGVVGTEAVYIY